MPLNNVTRANVVDELNRSMPAAKKVSLGTMLKDLAEKHNALLAKLDADTGVASTDYAATLRVKPPAER
jgi:hypothetical protein